MGIEFLHHLLIFYGAGDRNRTCNLMLTRHLLCLIELLQHLYWSANVDSTHKPLGYQPSALTVELLADLRWNSTLTKRYIFVCLLSEPLSKQYTRA